MARLVIGLLSVLNLATDASQIAPEHVIREDKAGKHLSVWDQVGSLLASSIKNEQKRRDCSPLVTKILDSIRYHLARRHRNSFVSADEIRSFVGLKDGDNGRELLTQTMRVLGNYTLAEGLLAGSMWTIDNQNNFLSCMENLEMRLDENTLNDLGDTLIQGDMAVTSSLCRYSEQSSKIGKTEFEVGTMGCWGVTGCQFAHPDEAVHFCNSQPECTLIMGKEDSTGCDGGLGCYKPRRGAPEDDATWAQDGGRTYIKTCPGALIETQHRVQNKLRAAGTRWADGEINYCFSSEADEHVQEAIHIAAHKIQEQVPCVNFNYVERGDDEHCVVQPSIIVTAKPSGCWSYVGQVSGSDEADWKKKSQPLNLARGCELPGIAMHELAHALGMVHQSSRADRNDVILFQENNTDRKEAFGLASDVIKYAWAGRDKCVNRAGVTKATMSQDDCDVLGGNYTEGDEPVPGKVACQLDICESGTFFPAPSGKCNDKKANMTLKMERKDCLRAQGTPPASPKDSWAWVDCAFDVCTDMGLHLAKPFACENKIAYGYFQTMQNDCKNMEGTISVQHRSNDWVNCYMDFCSGSFDTPFDFLSLMMPSPYAWAKDSKKPTLEPIGNNSEKLTALMGQRMGFSALDVFHLGHMYGCYEKIKPEFDSKDVSRRIMTGEYFGPNPAGGECQDKEGPDTGFDIHGDDGFMKHASCSHLMQHCENTSMVSDTMTMGEAVKKVCPVSCFVCLPNHGISFSGQGEAGGCFDAENTGIRFRDGPKASCKELINYCKHESIGPQVQEACKMSCGLCHPHIYAPFFGREGECQDEPQEADPVFTIAGVKSPCPAMHKYCMDHPDSFLVQRKCPLTCGLCEMASGSTTHPPVAPPDEMWVPGDEGNCQRRRRNGFCATRRRRNV